MPHSEEEQVLLSDIEARERRLKYFYVISSFAAMWQIGNFFSNKFVLMRLALGISSRAEVEQQYIKSFSKIFKNRSSNDLLFMARTFFAKYSGEVFVGVVHILASPVWSAIIPFQSHPRSRSEFPRIHRLAGLLFFGLSGSIGVGALTIMLRGLAASQHKAFYFKQSPQIIGQSPGATAKLLGFLGHVYLYSSLAWFMYTLKRAYSAAMDRKWVEHEEWALRHTASGQWVSLQRIFSLPMLIVVWMQKEGSIIGGSLRAFELAGYFAWAAAAGIAETAISDKRKITWARVKLNRLKRQKEKDEN